MPCLDLENLRVGKKVNVLLETKDSKEHPLERGGETVTAEIRHREAGVSRSLIVNVDDNRDGTYGVSFIPDVAAKLALIVKVNGEHIQVKLKHFNLMILVSFLFYGLPQWPANLLAKKT